MDAKKIRRSNGMVWSFKMGQMVSFLIHIGDRLNLFATLLRASMEAGLAVTTDELVATTGYDRRWLMEWLRGMAAAKVLEYKEGDDNTERFHLSPEMGEVLVNESTSLTYAAGAFVGMADRELSEGIVNAFRTGVGMSYRARSLAGGEDGPLQTARLLGAWTRIALVPQIIARLGDGAITSCLEKGGSVLDMGCGAGIGVVEMARAFPRSRVHGVDPDKTALQVARKQAAAEGILNCEFTEAKGEELEGEALYDFAVCLDIVHDCPFPDRILSTLCRLLKRKHSDQ